MNQEWSERFSKFTNVAVDFYIIHCDQTIRGPMLRGLGGDCV